MRVLILGGDGMLGHQLFIYLRPRHQVRVTLRRNLSAYQSLDLFDADSAYPEVEARSLDSLLEVMANFRPEVVVNCIGIIKQLPAAHEYIPSLEVNALFPHRLALLCQAAGVRLIHLSTDCVFSGRKGGYSESDQPDPVDLYGYTKLMGEVTTPPTLTLRTSLIGLELDRRVSLVEWFLAQAGPIKGYTRAIFSGFTTLELSRIIEKIMLEHGSATGLYHVAARPISKYDLLVMIRDRLGLSIEIRPDDGFRCDRSLDGRRFREEFGYQPPTWESMIDELCRVILETRS